MTQRKAFQTNQRHMESGSAIASWLAVHCSTSVDAMAIIAIAEEVLIAHYARKNENFAERRKDWDVLRGGIRPQLDDDVFRKWAAEALAAQMPVSTQVGESLGMHAVSAEEVVTQ